MSHPSAHARGQYAATTGNLTARMALHRFGTNPQSWWDWLAPRLPRAGRVLEVGAGTGELWRQLPHGPLTLVDFSAAMCARLRELPEARVVRADAGALPFAAGSFDTVIANHMLYHVDEPAAALREFARVLAPGGRVALAVNGRDHMSGLEGLSPHGRPGRLLNGFTAEDAPAAVGEFFAGVVAERYPGDLAVPEAEPLLAYLDSWQPLTPAERAAAGRRIRERIAAEGTFRIRRHTVLVTAHRSR